MKKSRMMMILGGRVTADMIVGDHGCEYGRSRRRSNDDDDDGAYCFD